MTLVIDEEGLAADAAVRVEPHGGGCSVEEIEQFCREYETKVEKADALIEEVGALAVVEALRRRGVLRDDRFDDWFG